MDYPIKNRKISWENMSFLQLVKKDAKLILKFENKPINIKNILWLIFGIDAFIILFIFRIRKLCKKYHIPLVNRVLRSLQTVFYSIELGNDILLGPGVYFIHSLGTVIGSGAIVGEGTVFYGNNTVGAAHFGDSPLIGRNVKIGAGSRVIGSIFVEDEVVIGANSVVTRNIPKGTTVGGIPAKPLKKS